MQKNRVLEDSNHVLSNINVMCFC